MHDKVLYEQLHSGVQFVHWMNLHGNEHMSCNARTCSKCSCRIIAIDTELLDSSEG